MPQIQPEIAYWGWCHLQVPIDDLSRATYGGEDSSFWWCHLWVPFGQTRSGLETGHTAL